MAVVLLIALVTGFVDYRVTFYSFEKPLFAQVSSGYENL